MHVKKDVHVCVVQEITGELQETPPVSEYWLLRFEAHLKLLERVNYKIVKIAALDWNAIVARSQS